MKSWTRELCLSAISVLGFHDEYRRALVEIGVTGPALRAAFARYGFDSPITYLGKFAGRVERDPFPSDKLSRLLFIPDTHAPYHDPDSWALMLKAAREFSPNKIFILGDLLDCYSISDHDKDPVRALRFSQELEIANGLLDEVQQLASVCTASVNFIAGNHEHRIPRYLMRKAPELFDMINIESCLKIKDRGWGYTPYGQALHVGELYITHDTGTAGYNANKDARDTIESNVVIGHTHQICIRYTGTALGKTHVAAMFGWLAKNDTHAMEYMHEAKRKKNWHSGFGIGWMESDGVVHLQAVPIIHKKCVINGRLIKI